MVPGGLEVMSYTTRLTRGTLLQMRADTSRSSAFVNSYLLGAASGTHQQGFTVDGMTPIVQCTYEACSGSTQQTANP
jgi:hypothetical protein